MAIVGLVLTVEAKDNAALCEALKQEADIVEVAPTSDPQRVAIVLESASEKLDASLQRLQKWDMLLNVDIAYINYEDDLETKGRIGCPPYVRKRQAKEQG